MIWQPIETAPTDMELVVVLWVDPDDGEPRYDFDYREDGCWIIHEDNYQHYCSAGFGKGPHAEAPYTHWMPLPEPPKE